MTWLRQHIHAMINLGDPRRTATASASPAAALDEAAMVAARLIRQSALRWCAACDVEWTGHGEPCWVCETHEHVCDAAARTEHEADE